MGRFIKSLLRRLWDELTDGIISFFYALVCLGEFLLCFSLAYHGVYQPMAAAPGSRDSAGLLFVGLFLLVGVMAGWGMLVKITTGLMQAFLPNWRLPDFSD